MRIRLGTRGSALARAQTTDMAARLGALGHDIEIVIIKTAGDRDQTSAFAAIGAPGVFVREIESALLDERIDAAVHSYKDLPSVQPDGLVVAAVPERVDVADRLIASEAAHDPAGEHLPLRHGATVGTSSMRRQALLSALRPDLVVEPLRGNVPTRLGRLREGRYDAILLAAAGLGRLERRPEMLGDESLDRAGFVESRLDPALFVPAPTQGALALECRAADAATREALSALHDGSVTRSIAAERRLLALIEGGCQVPFGAWCREEDGGELVLDAVVERKGTLRRAHAAGAEPHALAETAYAALGETEPAS